MQRRCCWPPESASALRFRRSLTSSQSAAPRRAPLDPLVHRPAQAEHLRGEGDVVVDRLREGVRPLEHHADPAPHLDRIGVRAVEVLAVVEDLAADLDARDEVVHAVQAADERALAAAGRADHRGDQVLVDVEADARQREVRPVGDARGRRSRRRPRALRPVPRRRASGSTRRRSVRLRRTRRESRSCCSGSGLEDVNDWCRAGERALGASVDCKAPREWTRRRPSCSGLARLAAVAAATASATRRCRSSPVWPPSARSP